jgi:hypothetical protein
MLRLRSFCCQSDSGSKDALWSTRLAISWILSIAVMLLLSRGVCGAGVTIITHGFESSSDLPPWVSSMKNAVSLRLPSISSKSEVELRVSRVPGQPLQIEQVGQPGQSDEILVVLNWASIAFLKNSGISETESKGIDKVATGAVAAAFADYLLQHQEFLRLPIHMIGHSRGASLISSISRHLGEAGIWVDQLTTLDPHRIPLEDDPVAVYNNVLFADNYYRTGEGIIPDGAAVDGAYNRDLGDLAGGYPDDLLNGGDHSDVHLWYHGTINLDSPIIVDRIELTQSTRSSWYLPGDLGGALTGFYYSRIASSSWSGGDPRAGTGPNNGLHQGLTGGAGARVSIGSYAGGGLYPNVATTFLQKTNWTVGDTVPLKIYFQDRDSTSTIAFFKDDNQNPFDDGGIPQIGQSFTGFGEDLIKDFTYNWQPTASDVGGYYVQVRVTDGVRTRYDYFPKRLTILSATPTPTKTNTPGGPPPTYTPTPVGPGTRLPIVLTEPAGPLISFAGFINGQIADNGGSPILERRFDWGTNPAQLDHATNLDGVPVTVSGSSFWSLLTGLSPNTTYYFRAWALNETGWGIGEKLSFTTPSTDNPVPTWTNTPVDPAATWTPTPTFTPLPQGGLVVSPQEGYHAYGYVGGPFYPSKRYTLTSTSGSSLDWSFSRNISWLSPSGAAGTFLVSGGASAVDLSVTNAASFPADEYRGSLFFTNLSTHNGDTTLPATLTIWNLPTICRGEPLVSPQATNGDEFGRAVATAGGKILVGVHKDDTGADNTGAAYLFDGDTGALLHSFINPVPNMQEHFGAAVALSENLALVGCADATGSIGAAYLFSVETGALLHTLENPDPTAYDYFGSSVAIAGNTLAVGAYWDDAGATNTGSVYLFSAQTGGLLRSLHNPAPSVNAKFGWSLAAVGEDFLVGCPYDDTGATNAGVAHLFDPGTGTLLRTFSNPDPEADDYFGTTLAAVGNTVFIGAPQDDDGNLTSDQGSVSVFDGGTGILLRKIVNPFGPIEGFGVSIAGRGNQVLIGSPRGPGTDWNEGNVFLFDYTTGELLTLLSFEALGEQTSNTSVGAQFGNGVAWQNDSVVVGVPFSGLPDEPGRVYVFSYGECPTDTPTETRTSSETETPTATETQTRSETPSVTDTNTETPLPTATSTGTITMTPTVTLTGTLLPSLTPTMTDTSLATLTATPSPTVTVTETSSQTATPTPSMTATISSTITQTPSITMTPTVTPTGTYVKPGQLISVLEEDHVTPEVIFDIAQHWYNLAPTPTPTP